MGGWGVLGLVRGEKKGGGGGGMGRGGGHPSFHTFEEKSTAGNRAASILCAVFSTSWPDSWRRSSMIVAVLFWPRGRRSNR